MSNDDWVVVGKYTHLRDAHIDKMKLESRGIDVFVQDNFFATVHHWYADLIGGNKLYVRHEDVEQATRLMEEIERENKALHGAESEELNSRGATIIVATVLGLTLLFGLYQMLYAL
jgi:hypothetical protein